MPSSGKKGKQGGGGAAKTVVLAVVAYLLGVVLSPRILPDDFLSSRLGPLKAKVFGSRAQKDDAKPPRAQDMSPTPAVPPVALPEEQPEWWNDHEHKYRSVAGFGRGGDPFDGVDIVVHRNGEPDPCSRQRLPSEDDKDNSGLSLASKAILDAADLMYAGAQNEGKKPLDQYTKYDLDAALTHALAGGLKGEPLLQNSNACGPTWKEGRHYLDSAPHLKTAKYSDMLRFCDMGMEKTPIQLDHNKLVRTPEVMSLPCHFHTREGVRVTSLEQLATLARGATVPTGECTEAERNNDGSCGSEGEGTQRELHLYAVQAGRVFVFAPKYVGEIFELPHVKVPKDLPVWLEVISLSPRVFDVFNFFDRKESAAIVDKALRETSETHRIKRSSTGASGYNVNSQRTSENGFDTHGTEAQAVKRRCMNVLGFDEYEESLTDGLQVLRYNKTTAYVPHLDWIDDYHKQQEHDFDTEHLGSNRFATILLYMSDLNEGDGGETVFSEGWPVGQEVKDHVNFDEGLRMLRESGDVGGLLTEGSWEEKMVVRCRTRLAVRPHSSRAVLFYSQNPDGTPDHKSMHGGCPVIKGEKWAANLWVWNAPRSGFPGSPVNHEVVKRNKAAGKSPENDLQKKAAFSNTKADPAMKDAKLWFQETFWGNLGFGEVINVNTYIGHQWNVKVGDKVVKTFIIDKRPTQMYTI